MNARQSAYQPKSVLYPVAALSLIAGLIHLWVTPEHFLVALRLDLYYRQPTPCP